MVSPDSKKSQSRASPFLVRGRVDQRADIGRQRFGLDPRRRSA
jgi:hypothetical protein